MPHRNAKSAGASGARHKGKRDNWQGKDSTGSAARNRAVSSTPEGRKSGWVRLADAIADAGADPLLREVLEAGRNVDAEPGDGLAAFLPDGEVLLLLATPDGLEVRRNVPAAEVAVFLGRGEVAA